MTVEFVLTGWLWWIGLLAVLLLAFQLTMGISASLIAWLSG
jgi:hypothetical protein